MKQLVLAIAIVACAVGSLRAQGTIAGDVTFAGNVYVTNAAPAPTSMSAAIASGGAWTNDGEYVWYRLAATNRHGQSAWVYTTNSVIVNVATGHQSATVTWTGGIPGASGYVLSRRTTTNSVADPAAVTNDASWPLWRGVAPYVASLTDVSATNWQTNAWASLAAWNRTLVYPWATTADIDARVASGHVAYATIAGTASNAPAYLPLAGGEMGYDALLTWSGGWSRLRARYAGSLELRIYDEQGGGSELYLARWARAPAIDAEYGQDPIALGWTDSMWVIPHHAGVTNVAASRTYVTTAVAAHAAAAPAWQMLTNTPYAATVTLTNLAERPISLVSTGAVTLAIEGLRAPLPLYLVVSGPTSLDFPAGAHYVGGASWQTNQANHFVVWTYGTNLFINPITTSEE